MSKKLVIVALLAILAVGVTNAKATPSRLETLGQQTGLVYIQDDTDIFTNPATVGYYRNMFILHLGGVDDGSDPASDLHAYGGVTAGLGEMLTLGLVFARNPSYEEGLIGAVLGPVFYGSPHSPLGGSLSLPNSPAWFNNWASDNSRDWFGYNGWDMDWATFPVDLSKGAYETDAYQWMNPIDVLLSVKLGKILIGASYYNANGSYHEKYRVTDDWVAAMNQMAITADPYGWSPLTLGTELVQDEMTVKTNLHSVKVGLSMDLGNIMPEIWFHYNPFNVNSKWEHIEPVGPNSTFPYDHAQLERTLKGSRENLGFRVFANLSDNWQIVPAFEWATASGNVKYKAWPHFDPTSYSSFVLTAAGLPDTVDVGGGIMLPVNLLDEEDLKEKYIANQIKAGVGINYNIEKLLLATSIGMVWSETKQTLKVDGIEGQVNNKSKYLALPIVGLGLEYQATKILVLRGGIATTTIFAKNYVQNNSDNGDWTFEDRDRKKDYTTQNTQAAVGMGLHFGNLVVDVTAGNLMISGEQGFNNLFSHLDMKYKF